MLLVKIGYGINYQSIRSPEQRFPSKLLFYQGLNGTSLLSRAANSFFAFVEPEPRCQRQLQGDGNQRDKIERPVALKLFSQKSFLHFSEAEVKHHWVSCRINQSHSLADDSETFWENEH